MHLELNRFTEGSQRRKGTERSVFRLKPEQMAEVRREALQFKEEARWTKPRILTGHPVAHAYPEKTRVVNFSTLTKLVTISEDFRVFLLFRYPLSWLHSLTDNFQRMLTGKRAAKPFRRKKWQQIVEEKSLIPVIPIDIPGVVALPYVPNWNLYDILHHRVIPLTTPEVEDLLNRVCRKLNQYHAQGKAWGETEVRNVIISDNGSGEPIICDGEVEYYFWVPLEWRKMSDWFDLIFSVCGAIEHPEIRCDELALHLLTEIREDNVKTLLIRQCKQGGMTRLRSFRQATSGRLGCDPERYEVIRRAIATA